MRHKTRTQTIIYVTVAAVMLTFTTMIFAGLLLYIEFEKWLTKHRSIGNEK
jgi:hypothetical protein